MQIDKTAVSIETYDHIVNEYIDYLGSMYLDGTVQLQEEIDYIVSLLPENARILDVGTAMGCYPKYLTEKYNKNFDVVGIDTSPKMIDTAIKHAPLASFKLMDTRKLDFNKSSFDCIICFGTLIHLNDEDCLNVLNKYDEILKKDGIIAINVMEYIYGSKELFENEPFNPKYKMYYNRFSKEFFI